MDKKRFERGQAVEVQRDTDTREWEPATYCASEFRGWHTVKMPEGKGRRISRATGRLTSDDDPHAFISSVLTVPSRRIRAQEKRS